MLPGYLKLKKTIRKSTSLWFVISTLSDTELDAAEEAYCSYVAEGIAKRNRDYETFHQRYERKALLRN